MIKTKKDLKEYIELDTINNYYGHRKKFNPIYKYLVLLRKTEYHINSNHRIRSLIYRIKFNSMCYKYLTFIPLNCFGPGLSIAHLGCIYVNQNAKVGSNCRSHEMVTIGATSGDNSAPVLGDNIFIGTGAKIIGAIEIANDVAIGAGAVVVKSIFDSNTTWAGVPAIRISNNDSHKHLKIFTNKDN